jgi:hypothetical protein
LLLLVLVAMVIMEAMTAVDLEEPLAVFLE